MNKTIVRVFTVALFMALVVPMQAQKKNKNNVKDAAVEVDTSSASRLINET